MNGRTTEDHFRLFLFGVALSALVATFIELWFTEHMESFVQLIPFILLGVGIVAVVAALITPGRGTLWALRITAVLLALGGMYGIYEHLAHNLAFELDIRPNATRSDVWRDALRGASPLLAPGALTLAAVLAGAATYRHPGLDDEAAVRGE